MNNWWHQLNDIQRGGVIFLGAIVFCLLVWWAFKSGKDGDYL